MKEQALAAQKIISRRNKVKPSKRRQKWIGMILRSFIISGMAPFPSFPRTAALGGLAVTYCYAFISITSCLFSQIVAEPLTKI